MSLITRQAYEEKSNAHIHTEKTRKRGRPSISVRCIYHECPVSVSVNTYKEHRMLVHYKCLICNIVFTKGRLSRHSDEKGCNTTTLKPSEQPESDGQPATSRQPPSDCQPAPDRQPALAPVRCQQASDLPVKVLLIVVPEGSNIRVLNTVRASFCLVQHQADPDMNINALGGGRGLKELKKSLGPSLVSKASGMSYYWHIHQLLATMKIATNRFDGKWQLLLRKWEWVVPLIRSGTLLDHLEDEEHGRHGPGLGQLVIFVSSTAAEWPLMSQDEFLRRIYPLTAGYSNIRLYPSLSEQRFEMLKIGDGIVLDRIAAACANPLYSFRPTTCYGNGRCMLQHLKSTDRHVLKRSESCSSSHVILTESSDRRHLICVLPDSSQNSSLSPTLSPSPEDNAIPTPLWFHQEYSPSLDHFELRVFIINDGGRGKIVRVTRTVSPALVLFGRQVPPKKRKRAQKDQEASQMTISAVRASPLDHFLWCVPEGTCPDDQKTIVNNKYEELQDFALYVYKELRAVQKAQLHYETLEVGVRLDIFTSEESPSGRFCVNEITRWCEADTFSESTEAAPELGICQELGEALASYL